MFWSYLHPSRPTVKEQMMSHSLCELRLIMPTHLAAASDHNKRSQLALFILAGFNPTDWACLPVQRCEGLFISGAEGGLFVYTYHNYFNTHCFFYLAQERWCISYCSSPAGPGGRRPICSPASSYLKGVSMRAQQVPRDRFHHLDGEVLMNILIISLNARPCWASRHVLFLEINMEKFGCGETYKLRTTVLVLEKKRKNGHQVVWKRSLFLV